MQFRGGGVGHKATRDWDAFLEADHSNLERMNETEEGGVEPEVPTKEGGEAEDENDLEQEEGEPDDDNDDDPDDEFEQHWAGVMLGGDSGDCGSERDGTEEEESVHEGSVDGDKSGMEEWDDLYGEYGYSAL